MKQSAKREDLKERLIQAADARIRISGLQGLRARDITADAGCALGALYNAFADLDDLVLHVNSLTLARLGVALDEEAARAIDPRSKFKALATPICRSRATIVRCGRRCSSTVCSRAWRHPTGISRNKRCSSRTWSRRSRCCGRNWTDRPCWSARERLFSAVHGIVAISLENRFIGLAAPDLEERSAQVSSIPW